MKIKFISTYGSTEAMIGLSFSFKAPIERMRGVAKKLCASDPNGSTGETKFLEMIVSYWEITAPRYWWQEFDTYRVGVTRQSASTMHTIMKRHLTLEDFDADGQTDSLQKVIDIINEKIDYKDFMAVKRLLPESFLQKRIVMINAKAARHIYGQRKNHKLEEWRLFCSALKDEFLNKILCGVIE